MARLYPASHTPRNYSREHFCPRIRHHAVDRSLDRLGSCDAEREGQRSSVWRGRVVAGLECFRSTVLCMVVHQHLVAPALGAAEGFLPPTGFETWHKEMSRPSSLLSHRQHLLKKSAAGAGAASSASMSQPLPPPSPNPKYTRFLTLPPAPSTPATCVMTQV